MTFPTLKTGAVAQYPLDRGVRFSTQSVRFLDGTQQKFRLYGQGLRRWSIDLNLLDEQELGALIDFVEVEGSGIFSFVDPISGDTAAQCVIASEQFDAVMNGELRGAASIVVEEIP
jgi:hypothetical protein